jgi:hypothetical protein
MKLLCIKSYKEDSGHTEVKHTKGKTYLQKDNLSIIDDYNNSYFWDDDMINEYFKSEQDIRNEALDKILNDGNWENEGNRSC